jgi:dipeptidyl aminopeptidase/acylaminoacyl peptidase
VSHAERLFEASHNPNAELWLVSDADHTKAYQTHTDEYLFRIISFFDQALK